MGTILDAQADAALSQVLIQADVRDTESGEWSGSRVYQVTLATDQRHDQIRALSPAGLQADQPSLSADGRYQSYRLCGPYHDEAGQVLGEGCWVMLHGPESDTALGWPLPEEVPARLGFSAQASELWWVDPSEVGAQPASQTPLWRLDNPLREP